MAQIPGMQQLHIQQPPRPSGQYLHWLRTQAVAAHQRRQQQQQAATRARELSLQPTQHPPRTMGIAYDDLPVEDASDHDFWFNPKPAHLAPYESACNQSDLAAVQSIVTDDRRTSAFLHYGLTLALRSGHVGVVRYLLDVGAPIVRQTPREILSAPSDQQLALFESLADHGWTPNAPGNYGSVLLPNVITNSPVLHWFLDHGADPNLGEQHDNRDRHGGSDTDKCDALEYAARSADPETVRMLLDAGAQIQYGTPLHSAAGVCPPGSNPYEGPIVPSKDFDTGRIPVMKLLVERGADVNQYKETRYMVPRYAIVYAVLAGAVERARWLLEQGADPEAGGPIGSAVGYARRMGSEEMKQVLAEGVAARRWVNDVEAEGQC